MEKPIKFGPFVFGLNLQKPKSWKERALNASEWEAWDRAQRRHYGWKGGLTFWGETNTPGSRVLLSRHWPHRLCWSWSIWVGRNRPGYDGPASLVVNIHRGYRFAHVRLGWVYARLSWQDSDYMLGMNHRNGPQILWAHHLKNMEAAGAA